MTTLSSTATYTPKNTSATTTTTLQRRTSCLVGHVTRLSSERTSLRNPETTLLRRLLLRSLLDLLLDGFRRGLRLLAAVHGRVAFLGLLEEPLLRRLGRSSIGLGVLVRLGSGLFLQRLLLAGCACGRCLRSLCL